MQAVPEISGQAKSSTHYQWWSNRPRGALKLSCRGKRILSSDKQEYSA